MWAIRIASSQLSKSSAFPREVRTFWSLVRAKSSGEVSEDEYSELETPQDTVKDESSDDLSSGSELSEDEGSADDALNELKTLKRSMSAMCKALLSAPALPTSKVLDKWVEEGNEVTESEVLSAMSTLRKRRLYVKALQAEKYVKQLPESLRTEEVYCTLLTNYVFFTNVKKAEELFNKMKDLEFPITCFACNLMMILYKKTDRKKIADVLLLMEKEDIKPSVFSYKILIDVKGRSSDIAGMEQLLEKMEAQGVKPSRRIQVSMAWHYCNAGLKDKTEVLLKELKGGDLEKNRWACRTSIAIYAYLGKTEEVERIWKVCESDPLLQVCLAAIKAWGQLKNIDKAEAAFDAISKKVERPSSKQYTALLKVYAKHKMLNKGKELVNQMAAAGCDTGPLTWHTIVKLYVEAGEVEKADSILMKAIKKRKGKPLCSSYMVIMESYAQRGDVHNAEKMFQMMKKVDYIPHVGHYESLLNAYLHAKKPAYGFLDRMKADGIFPNRWMSGHLASIDAFRKSPVSDLLE